jgi:hypothetical protein
MKMSNSACETYATFCWLRAYSSLMFRLADHRGLRLFCVVGADHSHLRVCGWS